MLCADCAVAGHQWIKLVSLLHWRQCWWYFKKDPWVIFSLARYVWAALYPLFLLGNSWNFREICFTNLLFIAWKSHPCLIHWIKSLYPTLWLGVSKLQFSACASWCTVCLKSAFIGLVRFLLLGCDFWCGKIGYSCFTCWWFRWKCIELCPQ